MKHSPLGATPKEAIQKVLSLYRSYFGTAGCIWDEYYPTSELVAEDIKAGASFCYTDGEKLVAVGVIESAQTEFDEIPWQLPAKKRCDFSRICVSKEYAHQGIGQAFVLDLLKQASALGYDAAALLVYVENPTAIRLYERCGFTITGQGRMFDTDWYYMECAFSEILMPY